MATIWYEPVYIMRQFDKINIPLLKSQRVRMYNQDNKLFDNSIPFCNSQKAHMLKYDRNKLFEDKSKGTTRPTQTKKLNLLKQMST